MNVGRMRRLGMAAMMVAALTAGAKDASFGAVDRRARAGEPLTVVFFGGSLTWGANATDPQLTSYRGRMMSYLRERYPRTPFAFFDAAIGGTGSDLGIFRLERDVLARKPDIVFLDFMANDNYAGTDRATACCYETLLRRLIAEGVAVEQMYFGFKGQFGAGYDLAKAPRRKSYRTLAAAYGVAEGDLFPVMQAAVTTGTLSLDAAWPIDGGHPGDAGYAMFFEAARIGFDAAVQKKLVAHVPEQPVYGEVTDIRRIRLADGALPYGWRVQPTYRTSLWFDGLSSRWMGDVATGDAVRPLTVSLEGNVFGLFGESDQNGLDVRVSMDGHALPCAHQEGDMWTFHHRFGQGNLFIWRRAEMPLASGRHTVTLTPVVQEGNNKGQLRIESVCAATIRLCGEGESDGGMEAGGAPSKTGDKGK